MILLPKKMWARRKRRPMMRQLRKSDLISGGVAAGGDVEVFGLAAEQQIAHAATHEIRGEIAASEAADDFGSVGIDLILRDRHER